MIVLALLLSFAWAGEPVIVERPIPFDAERVALTVAYRAAHYGDEAAGVTIEPRVVVLHWTAIDSLEASWNTLAPVRLGARPDLAAAGEVNVCAHFLVDRDGTIYRLVPETTMCRHVIGLNAVAVGVENVGGPDAPLTAAQADANAELVRWLAARFPITHLLGHMEYRRFEGHPYFRERDAGYRTTKPDPGQDFLVAVRARVADLPLEPVP